MIESVLNGSCCFVHRGELVESRFDLLLQTLNSYPQALLQETIEKLKLNREYFTPTIFEPEFSVKCDNEIETFPTKVFILSAGGNIARTVYRHREHGFLVDPGGLWLNHSVDSALKDMSTLRWFRRNFVNVGRMKVEDFREKTTKLVTLLKEKTGAHVILYSYLTAEPGNMAHNYQLLGQALRKRLLEFNIAISELSRDLDFPVVDINRILKEHGVREMVDFVHFPIEVYPAIGQEVFEIMRDLGVFE